MSTSPIAIFMPYLIEHTSICIIFSLLIFICISYWNQQIPIYYIFPLFDNRTHPIVVYSHNSQTRPKDGTTALLLSIFLGFFGIDMFYLNRPIRGIIKFATGGLGGWLYFYDILMILTDNMTDGNGLQLEW